MSFLRTVKTFPPQFWIANTMEIFERMAWYGFFALSSLYITGSTAEGGLGFSSEQRGTLQGVIPFILYVLPVLTGALADRFGYRLMFIAAYAILIPAYFLLGQFTSYTTFFFVFLLVAIGAAMFKPVVVGTVARSTSKKTSSLGFGIFYMIVNIGGFVGPIVAGYVRDAGWKWVFVWSSIWISVNMVLALLLFREPPLDAKKAHEAPSVFEDLAEVLASGRVWLTFAVAAAFGAAWFWGGLSGRGAAILIGGWVAVNLMLDIAIRRASPLWGQLLSVTVLGTLALLGWQHVLSWPVVGTAMALWVALHLSAETWLRRSDVRWPLYLAGMVVLLSWLASAAGVISWQTAAARSLGVASLLVLWELAATRTAAFWGAMLSAAVLGAAGLAAAKGYFSAGAFSLVLMGWVSAYLFIDIVVRRGAVAGERSAIGPMHWGNFRLTRLFPPRPTSEKRDVRSLRQVLSDIVVVLGNGRLFLTVFIVLMALMLASNGTLNWKGAVLVILGWVSLNLLADFALGRARPLAGQILTGLVIVAVGLLVWAGWLTWLAAGVIGAVWIAVWLAFELGMRGRTINYRLFVGGVITLLCLLLAGTGAATWGTAAGLLIVAAAALGMIELAVRRAPPIISAAIAGFIVLLEGLAYLKGAVSAKAFAVFLLFWTGTILLIDILVRRRREERPAGMPLMKVGDWRFAVYLLLLSGFWTMFMQIFLTMPVYIRDFVDTTVLYTPIQWICERLGLLDQAAILSYYKANGVQVKPEYIVNIDAGMIIIFQIAVSYAFVRFKTFTTLVIGTLMAAAGVGFALLSGAGKVGVLAASGWIIVLGIVIFAFGEMAASPKSQEYIGNIAPKQKVAMYMGYYFVAMALGQLFGGLLSGQLYGSLARDAGRPDLMWLIFGALGVVTAAGLLIYDWLVIRRLPQEPDEPDPEDETEDGEPASEIDEPEAAAAVDAGDSAPEADASQPDEAAPKADASQPDEAEPKTDAFQPGEAAPAADASQPDEADDAAPQRDKPSGD